MNIYLPDDLASAAKAADLNISRLTQEALRSALATARVADWLDELGSTRPVEIGPNAVVTTDAALAEASPVAEHVPGGR